MEIYKFFFKLAISLLLLLAVYFQTSLQQQPSIAPAPSDAPDQGPSLPPEEVAAVNGLLKLVDDQQKRSFSKDSCDDRDYMSYVTCNCGLGNNRFCQVTKLYFSGWKMEGSIPEEIGSLSNLTTLNLRGNRLQGTIPKSFANLSKLRQLDLSNNRLEGHIPSVLVEMQSLREIDLSNNFFNGTIPSQFGALRFLEHLDLGNNLLTGEIPKKLGKISSLSRLSLSDNMLQDQLPQELSNLRNLSYLDLSNNEFNGTLSPSFKAWKDLTSLAIQGNSLSGKIPDVVFSLQQLGYLSLTGNNFEAPLPKDKFRALKNVFTLYITDLIKLGEDSQFPDISKLTSLNYLTLRNCSLVGKIPDYLWHLPLIYLDLSFNKLSGGIPSSIDELSLDYFYLGSNELNESLPKWLMTNKTTILNVDFSENKFKNITIPTDHISNSINVFSCCSGSDVSNEHEKWMIYGANYCPNETHRDDYLYINCGGVSTSINGSTYESDVTPGGGSTFTLSDNKHWGYSSMGTFSGEDVYILNKTCNLTMVDAKLYQTARIAPISLKYYGFCLKKNEYIVKLHFAEIAWDENQFSGVKDRRVFNVEIQGKTKLSDFCIEAEAKGVDSDVVREFKVDVNDTLEIHLYWSGKGSTPGWPTPDYGPLISAISVSPVPKKRKKLSTLAISGIGGSASLSVILIVVLFWWLGWFCGKKRQREELKGIELYPGGFFNFRQIKAATQNFDASNKLGEGGFGAVYKGVLPNGTEIAVKQLSTRSRQGIREFVNEIGTISALQHPNLVRLMGCCVEDNQLLLIYEYMENNSLERALFGAREMKIRLNWETRMKICLGIAKGLAFLHEESKLKIIHRDIKPTNILLDKDLSPKISDFGFAKLFEEEKTHVITRIAGTTGYMAPEYAMRGHLTTKADVYSFGVVMLEIVSGKDSASYKPDDQTVFLLDLAYVLQEKRNLSALIDPDLESEYSWKQATTVLDLAMLCTNPSPTLRPTMSEVVKILEGKTKIKTTSTSAPYSVDNFTLAKAVAALSQSSQSGSNSQGGASSTNISHSVSKEIEESSFSAENSDKTIM